jgi:hypothetical protein
MDSSGWNNGMKITKKERKKERTLIIQKKRVQKIEDYLTENIDPVECPVKHHFTDNEGTGLNVCCREFLVPKGTILTGTIYKLECFWVMVKGRMRLIEGDHYREIEAPILLKNVVNTKNAGYAYEDCLFYGFTPNPNNSRNLEEVINIFSAIDANLIQGMPGNVQQQNYEKRQLCLNG